MITEKNLLFKQEDYQKKLTEQVLKEMGLKCVGNAKDIFETKLTIQELAEDSECVFCGREVKDERDLTPNGECEKCR